MLTKYNRTVPFISRLKKKILLTKGSEDKQVYHIELDITGSEMEFKVGDSLAVLPENDPVIIQKLLNLLSLDGKTEIYDKKADEKITLKTYLTKRANLNKVTSGLYELTTDKKPDDKKALLEYEVLDFISDHLKKPISAQALVDKLLPQMPRFYSIASSPSMHPHEIHLTVKAFTYQTRGLKRRGVASHFLCTLANDQTPIPIYPHPSKDFTLPENNKTPIIMIGPGTGIAPFRAFIQERLHRKAAGKNWLFFGERTKAHDFLYEHELCRIPNLELVTAFSRDQEQKIYVQHRLLEHQHAIYQLIKQGAILYVCGDAKKMAKDVESTLTQIVKMEGKLSEEKAVEFLRSLRKEKRYLLDVY